MTPWEVYKLFAVLFVVIALVVSLFQWTFRRIDRRNAEIRKQRQRTRDIVAMRLMSEHKKGSSSI